MTKLAVPAPGGASATSAGRGWPGEGWSLAGIVLLAFLLRLPGLLGDPVLLTEGTTYVTIGRNLAVGHGYLGILGEPDWFISPGYPLLIAVVTFLTANAELAGRLISLLLGSLLPLPVYLLARQCYGRRPATMAGLFVAGLPILVQYSSLVWSETTFMFLILLGLALVWRALQRGGLLPALAAGLLLGFAYLTRSEGVVYLALAASAFVLVPLLDRRGKQRWAPRALQLALLLAGFLLLAVPYVIALSGHIGQLTLESKGQVNFLIIARMETGLGYHQAAYGLSPLGEPEGPFLLREWILTHGWPPGSPGLSLVGRLRHVLDNLRLELGLLQAEVLSSLLVVLAAFGAIAAGWDRSTLRDRALGLMAALAAASLLPRPLLPAWAVGMVLLYAGGWTRERLAPLAFLAAFPLASLLVVAMAPGMFARYLVPVLPFLAILAAMGADRLATWGASRFMAEQPSLSPRRRDLLATAIGVALVGVLILSLPRFSMPAYHRLQDEDQRRAGHWLGDHDPSSDKRILSVLSQIPYYAGGVHVPMPDGPPEQVAAYAQARGADYAVISPRKLGSRPALAAWRSGEAIPDYWEPIYEDEGASGGALRIYRVAPSP